MAYCEHCGAYIPDGQKICLACGFDPDAEKKRAAEMRATQFMRRFVEENLPLNCITSVKQVGERTVAQIKRHTVLASVEHETDYEVETAPLSPDQVLLVEQLCESPETYIWYSVFKPITISSRTCEFSNERANEVTAKFTWRYLDGRRAYKYESLPDDDIFTEEYDPNYD